MQTPNYQLTRYPLGSKREMWAITWPLMLGLLSGSLMLFVDRLFLGNYSLEALSASANGSIAAYIFLMAPIITTGMSEVFVGKFHGSNEEEKMGAAVWQMLWISFFLVPVFLCLAKVIPCYLFRDGPYKDLEISYFVTLLQWSFFFFATPAFIGFFSGQGKTRVIALTTLFANVFNTVFDYLLIFGKWGFPELGIKGAAIATVSSQAFQAIILAALFFLSKKNCGQFSFKLNLSQVLEGARIGFPVGFAHASQMVVHLIFFKMMEKAGADYHTIAVIMQSIYLLLTFVGEGICKAVTATCSNFIGALKYPLIMKSLKSACQIHFFFFLPLFALVFFGGSDLFAVFFKKEDAATLLAGEFGTNLWMAGIYVSLFFLLDGWMWAMIGVLIASSDTKFIMIVGMIAQWVTYLGSVYMAIHYFHLSVAVAWSLIVCNHVFICSLYYLRLRKSPWEFVTNKR